MVSVLCLRSLRPCLGNNHYSRCLLNRHAPKLKAKKVFVNVEILFISGGIVNELDNS